MVFALSVKLKNLHNRIFQIKMVKRSSIIFVVIFFFILRFTFFFDPGEIPREASDIPSIIFLLTILLVMDDIEVIPKRYRINSKLWMGVLETILCLMVVEFAIVVLWLNLEKYLSVGINAMVKRDARTRTLILNIILYTISTSLWILTLNISNIQESIMMFGKNLLTTSNHQLNSINSRVLDNRAVVNVASIRRMDQLTGQVLDGRLTEGNHNNVTLLFMKRRDLTEL